MSATKKRPSRTPSTTKGKRVNKALCSICGTKLTNPKFARNYPNFVCKTCGQKALNLRGQPAQYKSIEDDGDNPVFIDGKKCWRRYRFGGYVTMLDDMDCHNLMEFYHKHKMFNE